MLVIKFRILTSFGLDKKLPSKLQLQTVRDKSKEGNDRQYLAFKFKFAPNSRGK